MKQVMKVILISLFIFGSLFLLPQTKIPVLKISEDYFGDYRSSPAPFAPTKQGYEAYLRYLEKQKTSIGTIIK